MERAIAKLEYKAVAFASVGIGWFSATSIYFFELHPLLECLPKFVLSVMSASL